MLLFILVTTFYKHISWQGTITNPIHCFRGKYPEKRRGEAKRRYERYKMQKGMYDVVEKALGQG